MPSVKVSVNDIEIDLKEMMEELCSYAISARASFKVKLLSRGDALVGFEFAFPAHQYSKLARDVDYYLGVQLENGIFAVCYDRNPDDSWPAVVVIALPLVREAESGRPAIHMAKGART